MKNTEKVVVPGSNPGIANSTNHHFLTIIGPNNRFLHHRHRKGQHQLASNTPTISTIIINGDYSEVVIVRLHTATSPTSNIPAKPNRMAIRKGWNEWIYLFFTLPSIEGYEQSTTPEGDNRDKPQWQRWRLGEAADADSNGNGQIFEQADSIKVRQRRRKRKRGMEAEPTWPAKRRR